MCARVCPHKGAVVSRPGPCAPGEKRPQLEILSLTAAPSPAPSPPQRLCPCQAPRCHLLSKKGHWPGQACVHIPAPAPREGCPQVFAQGWQLALGRRAGRDRPLGVTGSHWELKQ